MRRYTCAETEAFRNVLFPGDADTEHEWPLIEPGIKSTDFFWPQNS